MGTNFGIQPDTQFESFCLSKAQVLYQTFSSHEWVSYDRWATNDKILDPAVPVKVL